MKNTSWPRVGAMVALLTVIISVLLTAFAWPAARSSVHGVPIAVAGPAAATAQVEAALDQRLPGGFDVTTVAGTAAAENAIKQRDAYGAIDLTGGKPSVIVASAASPAIAQALQGVAAALGGGASAVPVRDLAALPADDPRGAGLAAAALPLVLGGMLAAILLMAKVRGAVQRLTGALVYSVTGGLAMAAILQFWLGSLSGNYLANSGVIALAVAATSSALLGLEAMFGTVGYGIGAAVMMLIGNPLSGATSAPQMLPGWSGQLGQYLPPGAAGWLLRSTAFFDGNGSTRPLIVLGAWLAGGAILVLSARKGAQQKGQQEAENVLDLDLGVRV